jgi:hypothetical protein
MTVADGKRVPNFDSDRLSIIAAHVRATRRQYLKGVSVVQFVLTGAAVILGFIGFGGLVWPHSAHDFGQVAQVWLDASYNTAGLLTFRLPRNFEQPDLPWELQIARFLLPALGIWLSLRVYLRLTRQKLRFFALFRLSDHVIVVGPGARASAIARLCKAGDSKRNLVYISDTEGDSALADLSALGAIIIHAPPLVADTYVRANLKRARSIVIAGDRGTDNIRACETIRAVVLDERPADLPALSLVLAIDSPEMAAVVDASFHEARDRRIEYRLLDPLDNIAQGLIRRLLPLLGSPNGPPTVVMIGWSGAAPAICRRLLRNGPPGFQLDVADENAELIKSALFASAPGLAGLSGLSFITCDTGPSLLANAQIAEALRTLPVAVVIVSGTSDDSNFRITVQLRRFGRTQHLWTPPIYVQQQTSNVALESLKKLIAAETIDVSRIYAFGSVDEQFAPAAVLHDVDETMARAVHERYLEEMRLQAPHAKPMPNTAPWEDLMETFRAASRAQAEHIDVKLANVQCCRVAREGGADFAFSDEEIERLSKLEHWRWCVDRWFNGWTYGPQKKGELLQHDQLKPYEDLTESQKDLDREAVCNLPRMLALSNAAIQREQHILVDRTCGSELTAAEALSIEAEACKRVGTIPVVDLKLAHPGDLALARTLQRRDLAVRLLLDQPFAVLAQSFPREDLADLVDALDAARDVVPAPTETRQQQPAAGTAEPVPDDRASECGVIASLGLPTKVEEEPDI